MLWPQNGQFWVARSGTHELGHRFSYECQPVAFGSTFILVALKICSNLVLCHVCNVMDQGNRQPVMNRWDYPYLIREQIHEWLTGRVYDGSRIKTGLAEYIDMCSFVALNIYPSYIALTIPRLFERAYYGYQK